MRKKDLTAVITMHNEGLLAHKTLRSVFEALDQVKASGYTYEIILHIDKGDEATKAYAKRYLKHPDITIYENSFGDLGSSRNFATSKANGTYVSFLDGDDLVSPNWYLEAIKTLESTDEEIVVHPEAILTFGIEQKNVLTMQKDSYEKDQDTIILLGENRWCSVVTAKKSTLLKVPYRKLDKRYSYEDYIFNTETTYLDIKHKVASQTVLFYRRSDTSMLSTSNASSATIPYLDLFDFDQVRHIAKDIKVPNQKKQAFKRACYKAYKKIRSVQILNAIITPFAKVARGFLIKRLAPTQKIPDFVVEEWKKINHIETQLCPYPHILAETSFYSADTQCATGEAYCRLVKNITAKPSYIFVVPWVATGGADKVLINYAKAIQEINPKARVLVITTLPSRNKFKELLPDNVDFVDFGNASVGLDPFFQDRLFCRLITQSECKKVHIINSEYGYDWARRHLDLAKSLDLRVSVFSYEYVVGMGQECVFDYADVYLPLIAPAVRHIYTDNATITDRFIKQYGFSDKSNITVHYQPVAASNIKPYHEAKYNSEKLHILWASRVCKPKYPELLCAIAKKLPASKYQIDVYGVMEDGYSADIFAGIPCVSYKGAYKGVSSIDTSRYDVFLYTSISDGMPNALLEMVSLGLPVIASDAGGIGELIQDNKTGRLIPNDGVDDFVAAIKAAKKDYSASVKMAAAAQDLLKKQHSETGFVEQVAEMIADGR